MIKGAILSDCGNYRYLLWRIWNDGLPVVVWVMLNPSTADADKDDPTIRRCVSFAKLWGAGGIIVVNLFGFRATDPRQLPGGAIAVAPADEPDKNWSIIVAACQGHIPDGSYPVLARVAAWGAHGRALSQGRAVTRQLAALGLPLECLGTTLSGSPRHPLYVKGATVRAAFAL